MEREREMKAIHHAGIPGTTGEHGGFSATAQFCTHEDVAPIAQVLHGPARSRAGVFDADFGVFCIVDKRQERKVSFERVCSNSTLLVCVGMITSEVFRSS